MRVKARPIFDTIDNPESLRPPAGVGARLGSLMYRMYRMRYMRYISELQNEFTLQDERSLLHFILKLNFPI